MLVDQSMSTDSAYRKSKTLNNKSRIFPKNQIKKYLSEQQILNEEHNDSEPRQSEPDDSGASSSQNISSESQAESEDAPPRKSFFLKNLFLRYFPYYSLTSDYEQTDDVENRLKAVLFEPLFLKNGISLYTPLFSLELGIFFFFIIFYDHVIGSSKGFAEALAKNRFAGEMVCVIVVIIVVILVNRVCYTKKFSVLSHSDQPDNLFHQKSESYKIYLAQQPTIRSSRRLANSNSNEGSLNQHSLLLRSLVHVILVFVLHYFFFIVLPQKNKETFAALPITKLCYALFFFYFALSAVQIRDGFCPNSSSNSNKGTIAWYENSLRQIYRTVPFIFEIKCAIDWSTTETSIDLIQWIKLEEARLHLLLVKYQMQLRRRYDRPIQTFYKVTGLGFLIILVGVAVFPIFLFSSLNPNYSVASPLNASLSLDLLTSKNGVNHSFNIFGTTSEDINPLSDSQFDRFRESLKEDSDVQEDELKSQVSNVRFDSFPSNSWSVSLPKKKELIKILENSVKLETDDPSKGGLTRTRLARLPQGRVDSHSQARRLAQNCPSHERNPLGSGDQEEPALRAQVSFSLQK